MARETVERERRALSWWVSGALLLLVPTLAVVFLGSGPLRMAREGVDSAGGGLGVPSFAFQRRSNATPTARKAPAARADAVLDVHLSVWEDTAARFSIRQP
jgi:hypothetical protein